MKEQLKVLTKALGDESSAKEVLKLTANYDKYVVKFKEAINKLLAPIGYEVKVGVAFVKKEDSKQ